MGNDLTKVYQFLASYGKDNAWVGKADKNGDGIVIKGEFTEFVNNEYKGWNGNESGETLSADIINEFWRKIDTNVTGKVSGSNKSNKNALDKDEQAALNKKIEAYVELSSFVKNNVKAPSVLTTTASQWKAAVTEELGKELEKLIKKGIKTEEIQEKLQEKYDEIYNGQTALFCAAEYQNTLMNGILRDYPDYKVGDDNTLTSIINAYLKTIDANATPSDIMSDIKDIMNSYLATAGICEDGSYDLSTLGYTQKENDKLNGIQESVVRSTLKKTLESIKSEANYEKYKEYYDLAIEEFINSKVSAATFKEFETLQSLTVDDFKGDKAYNKVRALVSFDTNYADAGSLANYTAGVFHQAIAEALGLSKGSQGSDLSQTLVKNWRDIPSMKAIMSEIKQGILDGAYVDENGALKQDDITSLIIKKVQDNMSKILDEVYGTNGMSELSVDELRNMYNMRSSAAEKIDDDDERTTQYKNAVLFYCNSVADRSDGYKEVVQEVFGSADYASVINNAQSVLVLKNYMTTLFTKIDAIKESEEAKIRKAKEDEEIKAKNDKALKDVNSEDKKKEVMDYINANSQSLGYSDVTFYVNDKGEIVFVDYDVKGGAFDDDRDAVLTQNFNKFKLQLETTYADIFNALGLSNNETSNLFNIALYLTLSDTSVVRSMYESQKISTIMESVLDNYVALLNKMCSDEKTRKYVKDYPTGSILSGTCTDGGEFEDEIADGNKSSGISKSLNKYYKDDSTSSGDDWVSINSRGSDTYTDGTYSGAIIILTSSDAGDNAPVNKAMKSMLKDYISSYSKYIDGNKIIELFRKAQETAFANLEATISAGAANGTSIYGYAETRGRWKRDNSDTYDGKYYGVNSILINVAYEMEKLIAREMAGLN